MNHSLEAKPEPTKMNTPSPLTPGSLQLAGKSKVRNTIYTILGVHALIIAGLLMQGGCKRPSTTAGTEDTNSVALAPFNGTNGTAVVDTAIPASTNEIISPLANSPTTSVSSGSIATPVTSAPILDTPTVATTTSIAPMGGGREYTVAKGDMLSTIAKKNGVSTKALQAANPSVDPKKLKPGQKLQIPESTTSSVASTSTSSGSTTTAGTSDTSTYVVKAGDTLTKIAKAHGTTAKAIKEANRLTTDRIDAGKKLKIPAGKMAVSDAGIGPVASSNHVTPLPIPAATTTHQ
jgi:LysM repeat protein